MNFKQQILSLLFLFLVQLTMAQGGTTIKASIDKNKILIGEPVQLTIEAYISTGSPVQFPAIDSLPHFELSEQPSVDTVDKEGGFAIIKKYSITSFDSGHWVIPSFILSSTAKSDTIPVDVVFSDFDPKQAYHDIKDILEVPPSAKGNKKGWAFLIVSALILVWQLYYFLTRKKTDTVARPRIVITPYDEAMRQLEQLQREKPAAKQFYSSLTDIFRLYIFRKKRILSLQKTTDDLVVQLRSLDLPKDQFDKLAQVLRLSDFVKFAKYIPSPGDDNNVLDEIKQGIKTIEQTTTKVLQ